MPKKKELDFVMLRVAVPMCVAKHIRNAAYEYAHANNRNAKEMWPILALWSSEKSAEVKKELTDAGILPG